MTGKQGHDCPENLPPLQGAEKSRFLHVRLRGIDEIRQAFGAAKEDLFTLVHNFTSTRTFTIELLSAHGVTHGNFGFFPVKACVLIRTASLSTRI